MVVDPPWNGKTGHNQYWEPLPYTAAQSLTRGDFPEGYVRTYAAHHLGRTLPADEPPQPGSPRNGPPTPEATRVETDSPLAPVEPAALDLQALGDYMSARLSGHSAQDALEACATEGQASRDVRPSLARAAAWYQRHHAAPQDPAAAAALVELLDPVARLQALGARKAAVSPLSPPGRTATVTPPAPPGHSRSPSPAPRSAAAMFPGPKMSSQCCGRYPRFKTPLSVADARAAPGSGNPKYGAPSGPLRRGVLRPPGGG